MHSKGGSQIIHNKVSKKKMQNPCREYSYCLAVVFIVLGIIVVSMTIIYLLIEKMLGAELWSVLLSLSILITIASRVIKSIKWSKKGFYLTASMFILSSISSIGLSMEYTSYKLVGVLPFILVITFLPLYMTLLPHLLLRRYITKSNTTEGSDEQMSPKKQMFLIKLSLKNIILYFYTRLYVYLAQSILYLFYVAVFLITLFYSLFTISSKALPIIREGSQNLNFAISALNALSMIVIPAIFIDTIHAYVIGSIGKELIINIRSQLKLLEDRLRNEKKSTSARSGSITMAIYRFDEFIRRLELGDLERSYIELTSALEAIRLWRSCRKNRVKFSDGREFRHSEIRGAIVHGSPKKKGTGINVRLIYFRTDPLTPIIKLLECLKDELKKVNQLNNITNCG